MWIEAFVKLRLPNKSMDVRAKQRLSYRVAWFLSACVDSVSPHVNSIVRPLPCKSKLTFGVTESITIL